MIRIDPSMVPDLMPTARTTGRFCRDAAAGADYGPDPQGRGTETHVFIYTCGTETHVFVYTCENSF